MKKVLYFMTMLLALAFTSCSKEEPGGTATQSMAGEWYVTIEPIDADGNVIPDDDLVYSNVIIRTFNASGNTSDKMYITDCNTFSYGVAYAGKNWLYETFGFYMPINVNLASGKFSSPEGVQNIMPNYHFTEEWEGWGYTEYSSVSITNGIITKNGGKHPNGSVTDAIEFDIKVFNNYDDFYYADTEDGYFVECGVDHFHVTGVRYSGLVENE